MAAHWDLMGELGSMQDRIHRMWGQLHDRTVDGVGLWMPAVDIYETDEKAIVVKADLPGLRREDIDLTVENSTLTIRAERRPEQGIAAGRFHRAERAYGTTSRSFTLPTTVDASLVKADYRDGVLTVRLPLRQEATPRQIQVDVQG